MRELTDSERKAREQAWIKHINDNGLNSSPIDFEAGLLAGLDYQQAQIAALTAEIDRLKQQIKARDILLLKIGIDPARIEVDSNG